MDTPEPTERTTADPTEQPDVPVYLPGTPTIAFVTRLERFLGARSR